MFPLCATVGAAFIPPCTADLPGFADGALNVGAIISENKTATVTLALEAAASEESPLLRVTNFEISTVPRWRAVRNSRGRILEEVLSNAGVSWRVKTDNRCGGCKMSNGILVGAGGASR